MKFKFLALILLLATSISAQTGYRIEIAAPTEAGKTIYLAKYWNDGTYAHDSTTFSAEGRAVLESMTDIPDGQYLLYIKPDTQFDLLLAGSKREIGIKFAPEDMTRSTIVGSEDTQLLWQYAIKGNEMRAAGMTDDELVAFTHRVISENRGTWFAAYLNGLQPIDLPLISSDTDGVESLRFMKDHFFDNVDLTDARLWTTSYFGQMIDTYFDQLVERVPDSMAYAATRLVAKTQADDFCFERMLSRLINKYGTSKLMGAENVWAKLAEDYIFDKNIAWIDSTQYSNLKAEYEKIKYNRIGMKAPDLTLKTIDGKDVVLSDIEGEPLLLYFYSSTCHHCAVELPGIYKNIYPKYKDIGFKIVAVNTNPDADEWKKFMDTYSMPEVIHCGDPDYKSQYWLYYDVSGVPSPFLLDKDGVIMAKKIDEASLGKVMDFYFKPESK